MLVANYSKLIFKHCANIQIQCFVQCSVTLTPMPKTEEGHFFLDDDPIYFRVILNWLRLRKVALDDLGLLKGTLTLAEYFRLDKLTEELKMIDQKNKLPSSTFYPYPYLSHYLKKG